MPTIQDALFYLGIDYEDDMVTANVRRALATAVKRLHRSVGEDVEAYLPDDPEAKELALIYTREAYDADNLTDKAKAALKHLREDLEPHLRLELQKAKQAAGVI